MAKIIAPNEQYTGVSASVSFVNGVGECSDPVLIDWFRDHGYTVEESDEEKPLEKMTKMTVKELKEYAELNGIELGDASKKDEILAVLLNQSNPEGDGDGTDSE